MSSRREKNGKPMKCRGCSYVWWYKGKSEYYCTCPRCLRKVKVATYQLTADEKKQLEV